MKYLFTIFFLFFLSTAVTIYFLWPSNHKSTQGVALSVNGHQMSEQQLQGQSQGRGYHGENEKDRISSIVTREILIQEAQRSGIDKEQEFREMLKNYYEQSLIKALTDRKLSSLKVEVEESEIDHYLSCFGKLYTFTRLPLVNGEVPKGEAGLQSAVLFDDLSEPIRILLSGLQPGQSASQFDTGTEIGLISLDAVSDAEKGKKVVMDRQQIRDLLAQYKRGREIDSWIIELKKKASIVVNGEVVDHEKQ
jgi:hypothetical protein